MNDSNTMIGQDDGKGTPGKMRGAKPTPRYKLAAAVPFRAHVAAPTQFAYVPKQLSVWGNDRYGDCVTAEEAFAKACNSPEIFIPEATVIAWARQHGVLNGADLTSVMDMMREDGFAVPPTTYKDGPYQSVDFSQELVLQAAIAVGPVKIGIDADALPSGAGSSNGWYATSGRSYRNEDHCVALCGYGPAGWLYEQLGMPLPVGLQASQSGYLLFTWSTIGFVSHDWIMGTVGEAWVRNPTTVIVPGPGTGGGGGGGGGGTGVGPNVAQVVVNLPLLPGTYPIGPAIAGQPMDAKAIPWQLLLQILIAFLNGLVPVVPPTPAAAEPMRLSA